MDYAEILKQGLNAAYACAGEARKKGLDPSVEVEVKVAADIAARVEQITGPPGVSEKIRSMEKTGMQREDIAFNIAKDIASGALIKGTKEQLIDQAVRTGTAILTEGVLVAPTEGIAKIRVKNNPDGSDYVGIYYAGPIRSAGGTAVALTVVLADIARRVAGVGDYRATDTQIERYVEEVNLYEARVAHLQYKPPEDDIRWIVKNCPICVDGEPTEDLEVSAYRSIPGVETNRIRGGIPLVICEGIAQKAAKLFKYAKKLALGWDWMEKIIKIKQKESKIELKPDDTYLEGLVAGRPVFAYPSTKGGFRLRYGRSRTNSMMARNIHPATMVLLDGFIAYGTHVKVERPGKGCVITPFEGLEPPVVRLKNGSVVRVDTPELAKELFPIVDKIIFLGDILVAYGDFLKSNHPLIPSAWCEEWWEKELAAKNAEHPGHITAGLAFHISKTQDVPLHPLFTYHWHDISPQQLKLLVEWLKQGTLQFEDQSDRRVPTANSEVYAHSVTSSQIVDAAQACRAPRQDAHCCKATIGSSEVSNPQFVNGKIKELILNLPAMTMTDAVDSPEAKNVREAKAALEDLLIPHRVVIGEDGKKTVLDSENAMALLLTLGMLNEGSNNESNNESNNGKIIAPPAFSEIYSETKSTLELVNSLSGIKIKAKAPLYIGARMGRPEKAKERAMDGKPNVLFPTGSQMRSFMRLYRTMKAREGDKTLTLELCRRKCQNCASITPFLTCGVCGNITTQEYYCQKCDKIVPYKEHCDVPTAPFDKRKIDIVDLVESAKKVSETGFPEDLKGVKGMSNPTRVPEHLEKGMLRAKHNVYVFRDGTSRFDASNVPLTHFIPKEIGLSLEKLRELGYTQDYLGEPVTSEDQLIQLKQQDFLIADAGAEYFQRVAAFIDDMLINFYHMKPFYNVTKREDLIGHLCISLSPHTSAGVLCRIIGFTRAHVGYAHPFMIAARRRNCFHPATKIKVFDDAGRESEIEISAFFEDRARQKAVIRKLDSETEKIDVTENIFVESINPNTNKLVKRRIKCAMRKITPPEYWVEIELESGIKKIVTPDHYTIYSDCGQLKYCEAMNARVGMEIPVKDGETYRLEKIKRVERSSEPVHAYCLDIETESKDLLEKNILLANSMFSIRCDGDEDCAMLLMDSLLNFSRSYLAETRGGTMDAPLVLTPDINPKEIDDEAHCIEFLTSYPLEFYHATERIAMPSDIKLKLVKDMLNDKEHCADIPLTHVGGDLDKGGVKSRYLDMESIPEKIATQFRLQERLRCVDHKNAVERLILSHFIPDLYGNLRSFYRQSFRCVGCNEVYRRPPLVGKCLRCGGNLLLTINKGGIEKYLEISKKIVDDYGLPLYLKQRLELLEKEISAVFEDDKVKQMGLSDFV